MARHSGHFPGIHSDFHGLQAADGKEIGRGERISASLSVDEDRDVYSRDRFNHLVRNDRRRNRGHLYDRRRLGDQPGAGERHQRALSWTPQSAQDQQYGLPRSPPFGVNGSGGRLGRSGFTPQVLGRRDVENCACL